MASHPVPISSDVFSYFGVIDAAQHDSEAMRVFERLLDHEIPNFANWLMSNSLISQGCEMHKFGINCRFLGKVFDHVVSLAYCDRCPSPSPWNSASNDHVAIRPAEIVALVKKHEILQTIFGEFTAFTHALTHPHSCVAFDCIAIWLTRRFCDCLRDLARR